MSNIRKATIQDCDQLSTLLCFLFEQEADFSPDTVLQEKGLKTIIKNQNIGKILVLENDGKIIAMVNLLFTISTALGGKVAILEDMVVHPDFRSGGYGSELLQAAIVEAKYSGCSRITLLTDLNNHKAQAFYRKHGFESSAMTPYRLSL